MKQNATNSFQDGINLDLHPIVTPNSVLTDNLNGTFITYNGNEFCLQNDKGNEIKAFLSPGFTPVGVKEHNGVLYILSCNKNSECEIGTYPGVDWSKSTGTLDSTCYTPLQNLREKSSDKKNKIFRTLKLNFDLEHPATIEIQDSYDGSVNLILTDEKNPPKMINTGFSVTGDKYKIINRNVDSNIYLEDDFDQQTALIKNSTKLTRFEFGSVSSDGQLKGGNYTFYLKYGDDDGNKTDIICESSIVSIFKGSYSDLHSVSGTLADERTDKSVSLVLKELDTKYSKVYLSYSREYSDTNGYRMYECQELTDGYPINDKESITVLITGFEEVTNISEESLNIQYHTIASAKAIAQQQDMLFLGNITTAEEEFNALQNYSYKIDVRVLQYGKSIGNVNPFDYTDSSDAENNYEYYNPKNIYSKLGYWPDEIYRFGIVYVKSDGSKTPVFDLAGCVFTALNEGNNTNVTISTKDTEGFFGNYEDGGRYFNKHGVFKTPRATIGSNTVIKDFGDEPGVYPWYFQFKLPDIQPPSGVIGYFIVRQKRIPTTILQGLKINIHGNTHIPIIGTTKDHYVTESFLTQSDRLLKYEPKSPTGSMIDNPKNVYYQYFKIETRHDSEIDTWSDEEREPSIYYSDSDLVCIIERKINDNTVTNVNVTYYSQEIIGNIKTPKYELDDTLTLTYGCNDFNQTVAVGIDKWTYRNVTYFRAVASIYVAEESTGGRWVPALKSFEEALYEFINEHPSFFPASKSDTYKSDANFIQLVADDEHPLTRQSNSIGLLSLDPAINNSIRTILDGSDAIMQQETNEYLFGNNNGTLIYTGIPENDKNIKGNVNINAVYIQEDTKTKVINNKVFQNVIGNSASIQELGFISNDGKTSDIYAQIIRGIYTPYIGITQKDSSGEDVSNNDIAEYPIAIYSLRKSNIEDKSAFVVRMNDHSPYYTVSDLSGFEVGQLPVYRGDCFSTTQSHRMIRNFIDNSYPYTTQIVDENNWKDHYKGYSHMHKEKPEGSSTNEGVWSDINVTDVNTVSLGHWVSFKCLSSYNVGLRSINSFNVTETSLLGGERKFWPLNTSTATADKVPDSYLLNDGYNATVSRIRQNLLEETPFIKREYSNRIMFSNKSVTNSFTNGYRVFQGLSYNDYDKQYGSIVKLVPWGNNLFCVFEHGLAILPVNEKALMQTTTEQTIHIYGHGVLPDQMSIVSQDYGTQYADSVVRTPIGIYGVDVNAKKIWRFSDKQGFETLSDMKIESFLNSTLSDTDIKIGVSDIRSHYNSFKGDIMFTWYYNGNKINSICYNERQSLWTTRYDWVPMVSENINGHFFSIQDGEEKPIVNNEVINGIGIYSHNLSESSPTKWYGKQHPFEFEFVVSDPIGVHKIFENLQIISNNVQPEELQFEIIGDSYMFNKERLYHTTTAGTFADERVLKSEYFNRSTTKDPNITDEISDTYALQSKTGLAKQQDTGYLPFRNASILNDRGRIANFARIEKTKDTTKQYHLVIPQECRNLESWGRRLGNIQYKADSWYTNIEPLIYDARLNDPNWTHFDNNITKWNSARIRDKWCKIRVRYSGEDLAVITAIKTILNI